MARLVQVRNDPNLKLLLLFTGLLVVGRFFSCAVGMTNTSVNGTCLLGACTIFAVHIKNNKVL